MRVIRILILTVLLLAGLAHLVKGSSNESASAHAHADAIELPRLIASLNEYVAEHPGGKDHIYGVDVRDVKRFEQVCKDYEAWKSAMKRAGY